MQITVTTASPQEVECDLLAVLVPRPVELPPAARALDEAVGGALARLAESGEARGGAGSVTVLHGDGRGVAPRRVALAGLGRAGDAGPDQLRRAVACAARAGQAARGRTLAVVLDGAGLPAAEAARCAVDATVLGTYRFDGYRTTGADDRPPAPETLVLVADEADARVVAEEAARAAVVAAATNRARDLQNGPPDVVTPERLAERAREIAAAYDHVEVEVLDTDAMAERGMGAFLAVARASAAPARLVAILSTPPGAPDGPVLGLVGKGVTFDSGGISLKPAKRMAGMKSDMSGAAAVLEATAAVLELGLPLRLLAVVGATENMPDTHAFKPSEIVRAANGKTIEITNTDAEGRLVLADCLHYARERGATHVVDIATLTGACVVALGDWFGGLMGRDGEWLDRVRAAGERSGEHVWPLPLHDTWRRLFRSDVADMANSSDAGMAGTAYAARFLQEFAGDGPWAHLDIAGVAYLERLRDDEFRKGGTGFGVRLMTELAATLC